MLNRLLTMIRSLLHVPAAVVPEVSFRIRKEGVRYTAKGYKKASCRNGTRLDLKLCIIGCQALSEYVILRLIVSVMRQLYHSHSMVPEGLGVRS